MIYQGKALTVALLDQGIAELRFDLQGDSVNKFNQLTLRELAAATAAIAADKAVRGVLVTSGKDVFIVGADITEFSDMFRRSDDELQAVLHDAQQVFNAVEDLPVPTVVAINGVALGGGFEMCLACDYRVLAEGVGVGLPEVKLGINPGFGGTVRLPRLIGSDNAAEWIATGEERRGEKALSQGAVDAVVPGEALRDSALQLLTDCIAGQFDWRARRVEKQSGVQLNDMERLMAFTTAKALVAAQAGPHMPAPVTAVKSMEKSAHLTRDEALEIEAKHFVKLARTPQAAALIGMFLNDQNLSKRNRQYVKNAADISAAGVLGAGIMGGGIAYQAALKGTPVLMKDIAEEGLALGMSEANKQVSRRVERGRMSAQAAGEVLTRIRPTLGYDGFDKLDVVVEAVVENPKVKHAVLAECEIAMSAEAVLASNTSTISIDFLAKVLQRPENFCGMHFFNPVHRMPLVEVIRGSKSSDRTIATVVAFARAMGKTPIVVNDCPGFYVNRVLFPYFAGFNLLVRDGADFHQVDKVMERFGWPMGPAYLLDVVGLDTAAHAAEVMAEGFPDRMRHADKGASQLMYEAGRYGQKNNKGFYRYETDRKGRPAKLPCEEGDAIAAKSRKGPVRTFAEDDIVARMMVPMCIEVVRCLDENIVSCAADADLGLAMGIGFPVFRGGALRYIDSMGAAAFCEMADRYAALGKLYEPTASLRAMAAAGDTFYG